MARNQDKIETYASPNACSSSTNGAAADVCAKRNTATKSSTSVESSDCLRLAIIFPGVLREEPQVRAAFCNVTNVKMSKDQQTSK